MVVILKELDSIHGIRIDDAVRVSCGETRIIIRCEDGRELIHSTDEYRLISVTEV